MTRPNAGEDTEKLDHVILLMIMKKSAASPVQFSSLQTMTKENAWTCNYLPCDLAIILLNSYPREVKIYVHTKTATHMFIEALLLPRKANGERRLVDYSPRSGKESDTT